MINICSRFQYSLNGCEFGSSIYPTKGVWNDRRCGRKNK